MDSLILYSADDKVQDICLEQDFEKVKKSLKGKAHHIDYMRFSTGKRTAAEVIPLIMQGTAKPKGGGHICLARV